MLFIIFILLLANGGYVSTSSYHVLLPFLPTNDSITVNEKVTRKLGLEDSLGIRKRRQLASVLTLLWPQVVGPMDNGIIKEESYDDVPKTPLEHQLEGIRLKSAMEKNTRQQVRAMLNAGGSDQKLTYQQVHDLHWNVAKWLAHVHQAQVEQYQAHHPLHQIPMTDSPLPPMNAMPLPHPPFIPHPQHGVVFLQPEHFLDGHPLFSDHSMIPHNENSLIEDRAGRLKAKRHLRH